MLFRGGYHTSATPSQTKGLQHLAAIPAHGSRGKALICKGLSEGATFQPWQFMGQAVSPTRVTQQGGQGGAAWS